MSLFPLTVAHTTLQYLLTSKISNKNTATCLYNGSKVRIKTLGSFSMVAFVTCMKEVFSSGRDGSLNCSQEIEADENIKPKSRSKDG